jgi:ankyrin repeat protein
MDIKLLFVLPFLLTSGIALGMQEESNQPMADQEFYAFIEKNKEALERNAAAADKLMEHKKMMKIKMDEELLKRGIQPRKTVAETLEMYRRAALPQENQDAYALIALMESGQIEQLKNELETKSPNSKDEGGNSLLHKAVEVTNANNTQVMKLLLAKGADVNGKDLSGATPLHWAALQEDPTAIQLLLDFGADANLTDNQGKTALDLANDWARNNNTVKELLYPVTKKSWCVIQ